MSDENRPRILLVEDSPTDALLVRHALRKEYRVDIAGSGQEAKELLESRQYLVVITDYKLPGMTGLDLLGWIQRKGLNVPVIVASSQGDERVAASALKQGAYDYVIKSEDSMTALPIVVRQALRRFDLEQRNRLLTQIVEDARDTILTIDFDGRVTTANQAVQAMFGVSPEGLVGRPVEEVLGTEDESGPGVRPLLEAVRDGEPWHGELSARRPDGATFPVHLSASLLRQEGMSELFIAIVSDISERRQLMGELARLSVTDDLTGLHNHRYFREKFRYEFLRSSRYRRPLALIMIDIDFFKNVNDTYGHQTGDEVLRSLADRLRESTRDVDIVTRYGGEEFAILLPDTDGEGASTCANHVWRSIGDRPIEVAGASLRVTASLGWATLDRSVSGEEELLRRADRALYAAKDRGRNNVCSWREIQFAGEKPTFLGSAAETPYGQLRARLDHIGVDIRARYIDTIEAFLERHGDTDPILLQHTQRVVEFSTRLAWALGENAVATETLRNAAVLHDLGKLAVPGRILLKPGPLTAEERRRVNEHTLLSEELASRTGLFEDEVTLVRHHHEHYDGTGLPDGLAGEAIPRGARVLTVADAYEAMTATRPYRSAMTPDGAFAELRKCAGSQFDPELVETFIAAMEADADLSDAEPDSEPPSQAK